MDLYVISGVTGMTGNEMARQLVAANHKVIGFDNFFASSIDTVKDLLDNKNFVFHEYDLDSAKDMKELANEVAKTRDGYDRLVYVNCAAVVHTEHFYYVNRTFTTNVVSMKTFLDQAIELKADVYINCSTSEVYSMNSWAQGGVKEDVFLTLANAEHSQRTSYAVGKLMTEFFMRDAVQQGLIKGCSIRFANVYSKHELYPKHIIPHIINSLIQTGGVELLENSKINRRTFLHNYDSCSAVIALINTPSALDGTVYNVGTEEEITIIDLVKLCADKLGIKDPQIVFNGFRASDPERRLLSTEKLRKRTGWTPSITLDKGISMCVEDVKK
ncbi:MAG: NAD(P)-dependent oxidoreductase [Clostridia bacterium]|nr:NAD(P)-dependent oxidoreductase [Clostridia bacterium]